MTHHTRVLPAVDQIIVLKDGVITEVLMKLWEFYATNCL